MLARTAERLLLAPDGARAAGAALEAVLDLLDVRSAAVLRIEGDRLVPIARLGEESERAAEVLDAGLPFRDGPFRDAWRAVRTRFVDDAGEVPLRGGESVLAEHGAVVPVADARGETRALLTLATRDAERAFPDWQRGLLDTIATTLGATLQRLQLEHQLHQLLDVVRALAQTDDAEELYAMAVAAAVRLIPGAEAATILVNRSDGFRFAAGHGYDMPSLSRLGAFGEEEQLLWYGLGRDAFLRGVPRVLRGSEIGERSATATRDDDQVAVLRTPGRVDELQATLLVPIVAGNDLLGILNVDNLSLEEAFGDAEVELAEAFGQQIGAIIRQTQTREALARAAVTDPVTGIGNREGFNQRLETELARARRREEPVHLVMMDLNGFKRINDEFGHPTGDVALQRVARALEGQLRAEDGLFRWGGDEFVLLISGVDDAEVRRAARRHAAAVERVEVEGRALSLSTGIASFPRDGTDAPQLLRRADDLMYRRKHASGAARDDRA